MPIIVKPGRYLIEKSRRRIIGVIALVGTGGSVPKPVQTALDSFASSIHAGQPKNIQNQERDALRVAMKTMSGRFLILTDSGLRWADSPKGLAAAMRNTGWKPPADQLALLLGAEKG